MHKFPCLSNPEKACNNEMKVRSDNFLSTLMSFVCKLPKEVRDFVAAWTQFQNCDDESARERSDFVFWQLLKVMSAHQINIPTNADFQH